MWSMMPMMRMRSQDPMMDAMMSEAEGRCPRDCWQEEMQLQMSFTILSDENFRKAWEIWQLPKNRTKFDAVFMELFFTTLTAEVFIQNREPDYIRIFLLQVTMFTPMGLLDILSTVGGMLGLFLGGSLFSLIELVYDSTLVLTSMTKAVFILCNAFQ